MDILKYIGSLEIDAKDEEQLSKFLNEKESEIKDFIKASWQNFSVINTNTIPDEDAIKINDVSAEETEISFFDNQNKEIYQAYIY